MVSKSLYKLDSFPVVKDVRKVNSIGDDFYIFNDLKSMPLYHNPTRLEVLTLSICLEGYTRVGINMEEYYVGPGTLIVALPDQIMQSLYVSEDYQGVVIAISNKYSDDIFPRMKGVLPFFLYTKEYPCLNLQRHELHFILQYFNMFWERLNNPHSYVTKELVLNLSVAMLHEIFNIYHLRMPRKLAGKDARKDDLYDRFMRMVSDKYKNHREVSYYADELNVSSKYLSSIVKEISGKTAGDWIDVFVIYEAKKLLRSSKLNVQEIADELNFPNQSYFGKYFRQKVGMTPKNFRRL